MTSTLVAPALEARKFLTFFRTCRQASRAKTKVVHIDRLTLYEGPDNHEFDVLCDRKRQLEDSEVARDDCSNLRECVGELVCSIEAALWNHRQGKWEISEKTYGPAAPSGTIPTYKNPGVSQLGIEPGSPLCTNEWSGDMLAALNIKVLKAAEDEVWRVWSSIGMQGWRKREILDGAVMRGRGKTGDPREKPPTNGTVRHDSHLRKSDDPASLRLHISHGDDRESGHSHGRDVYNGSRMVRSYRFLKSCEFQPQFEDFEYECHSSLCPLESGVSAQLRRVVPGDDVQSLVSSAEVSLLQAVHGIIKQHECSGEKSPSTKKSHMSSLSPMRSHGEKSRQTMREQG
ncbi:hypothetical protein PR048_029153 [Dryococelus australis]|uniref:Uncharacterized protein n=1 Tax=Dryococelus australis TaxID=614101 RepID=A0ABQ9GCN4_9NEOP|nr:hypothetical protein PR048_029153 [Dryococelus australis]